MSHGTARPGRRAIAEWVLEQLYAEIFSGRLSAGTEVGEIEVSERFGVSRSPVREALRQLEFDGLVVEGARNGLRIVRSFTASDIAELYDVRAVLEALSFSRAASVIGDEQLAALDRIQVDMERAEQRALDGGIRDFGADITFHREVCRAAGLSRLERTLHGIWMETQALLRQMDSVGAYPGNPVEVKAAHQDHRDLLDALRARDPDLAQRRLVQHLKDRRDAFLDSVRGQGLIS
jgi:DNA-binding GntR family transcriptional regulator